MLYNEAQYNEQPYQFFALSEIISMTDVITRSVTKQLTESIFLSDLLTRQITQKLLTENLRFLDWISWKQQTSQWFD